jgi:hypothetical protein
LILAGQKQNIRKVLKSGDIRSIKELKSLLSVKLLFLANTYTGAKFQSPKPTKEEAATILTCTDFIIDMFPQMSVDEIEQAFKMAYSGKVETKGLETYYGKFTVQLLGKILKSYNTFRTQIRATYDKEEKRLLSARKEAQAEELNNSTRESVISKYNELKKDYIDNFELDESKIKSFWGRILVEAGLINFTAEEKRAIFKEAKELVRNNLSNELMDINKPGHELRKIRSIIQSYNSGFPNDDFERKASAQYSKLLIKKSIINES